MSSFCHAQPVEDRASRRASKNNRRKAKKKRRRRRESDTHEATSREELAYKWLQVTEPPMPSSAYVPQIGDEVVYLKVHMPDEHAMLFSVLD